MLVNLDIPDALADQLCVDGKGPARAALEAVAVDGYRTDRLSEGDVRELLGYETPMQVHELLQQHGVYVHYSLADFEQDKQTLEDLRQQAPGAA